MLLERFAADPDPRLRREVLGELVCVFVVEQRRAYSSLTGAGTARSFEIGDLGCFDLRCRHYVGISKCMFRKPIY